MNTVRSSRSESMYSLPVCGVVTPACAPGLPPLAATLMALPSCSMFDYRTIVRYSTAEKRYSAIGAQARHWRVRIALNDRLHRLHDRRRDLLGDGAQARQETFAHLVARRACRMSAQVERGDRLAAAVEYRHRDRPQAALELFVDDGKSLRAVFPDAVEQRLDVDDRRWRESLEAQRSQPPPQLRIVEIAELDPAQRRMESG